MLQYLQIIVYHCHIEGHRSVHKRPLHPFTDYILTRFWMVINEESKQRKFIQYIAPKCVCSTACPSRQRSSWSGRRCLAECPTKLCRLSTPRIGGDYSKCTLNSWAISVMLWFLNIWSHIEESVISTFLLLGFLFRLCINLLQILDNLLSCLKEQGLDFSY